MATTFSKGTYKDRYSVKEAADKLGMAYLTLLKMIREGRITQYHQISERNRYFTPEDLAEVEKSFLVNVNV